MTSPFWSERFPLLLPRGMASRLFLPAFFKYASIDWNGVSTGNSSALLSSSSISVWSSFAMRAAALKFLGFSLSPSMVVSMPIVSAIFWIFVSSFSRSPNRSSSSFSGMKTADVTVSCLLPSLSTLPALCTIFMGFHGRS